MKLTEMNTSASIEQQPIGEFGNYLILRQIGHGGNAHVYLAEHMYLKTQVAVKLLNLSLASSEEIKHFLFEAQLHAHLRHQHIVHVLDFGWKNGTPFMVMEHASRGTLKHALPQGVPLPLSMILPFILQAASALQYVHNQGVIHCDVKPDNFLLGLQNKVLLGDFGIATTVANAKTTIYDKLQGTVKYLSPEQIQGKPQRASDQYALAMMVYQWLSGHYPFHGTTLQICVQHLNETPPPLRAVNPLLSPKVERVILKALAKDPAQRYPYIQEFAYALKDASKTKGYKKHTYISYPALRGEQGLARCLGDVL